MTTYSQLRDDFRRQGYYRKATARIMGQWLIHTSAILGGFALCMLTDSLLLKGLGIVLASVGSLGIFTNCHTASHYATSEKKWFNELLTYFGYPFVGQVSAMYWWHKHVVGHHPAPNVIGVDEDIDIFPWFAYTREQVEGMTGWRRLYYRFQGLFLPLALAVMGFEVQIYGWCYLLRCLCNRKERKAGHWVDLGVMLLHWVAWYAVPLLFFPLADVLVFNIGRCILTSYGMFIVFGPAHFPAEAAALDKSQKDVDYVLRQTTTTINFRTGWFGRLLCAGVEYQIEHHLFPGISHVYYPEIAPVVEEFCRQHGYPYRTLGWGEAVWKAYLAFWDLKPTLPRAEDARVAAHAGTVVRLARTADVRRGPSLDERTVQRLLRLAQRDLPSLSDSVC